MLSVAVAALNESEPERLWPLLAEALPALCGGETLIYKLDEWNASSGTVGMPAAVADEFARLDAESLGLLREGYPFAPLYTVGRDRTPVTAGRAAGRAWSTSPTARLIGGLMDADHVLAIPLPKAGGPVTGCMVYRSGGDFTDDQVRAACEVQPLLAAVDRQRQLLERLRRSAGTARDRAADTGLTPRETTVLLLLTDALTADAIGRRLGISDRTVHKHIEKIYRKLGTRDRISTVLRAQQLGLVPAPSARR
ncbi:LuxR C-terminal-related transcriptional regulator [Streptomyces sp. CdTB01]|uniref:helix-turn-helix transcriptional regulator n=1 Tax=Streptomyces sp. CdTB01 TaxID=1725411 RepID=UPI00073A88FB|nr:LuxR C-terminal-related transcriptional regulator [Streptomyces sp. CdTB01]ALV38981.1 helix-turn-helix transcriptional regulator [Streptomyces sp. CdTB01]